MKDELIGFDRSASPIGKISKWTTRHNKLIPRKLHLSGQEKLGHARARMFTRHMLSGSALIECLAKSGSTGDRLMSLSARQVNRVLGIP